MLAEGEFRREARRVLARLAGAGAYLRRIEGGFGLFVARNRYRRPVVRVEARVVRAFRSRDLLAGVAGNSRAADGTAKEIYRLSDAGAAYLRRVEAQDDHPYAAQHRLMGIRPVAADGRGLREVSVNEGESPIGWLRRRKGSDGKPLLSAAAYDAAERLREDFTKAQLMPRVTADWSLAPGTAPKCRGPDTITVHETALAARERVRRALAAVGPGLADALIQVCCHLKGLEEAERDLNWPRRSGKLVLSIALERLAIHYGLVRAE